MQEGEGGVSRKRRTVKPITWRALQMVLYPRRPLDRSIFQIDCVRACPIDRDGSLKFRINGPRAEVSRRIPVEAEIEDSDGVTIHVLLHVADGLIDELELYREDSAPIRDVVEPNNLDSWCFRTSSVGGTATVSAAYNGAAESTSYTNAAANMTAATYNGDGIRATATSTPAGGSSSTQSFVWSQAGQLLMDSANAFIYGPQVWEQPYWTPNCA
ncbi:MAG: hypothetical protein JWM55_721 [Acidimicrobiaceae bacterium]|nr:hypothetical protein [Acidimicrobiaceae bacterium]